MYRRTFLTSIAAVACTKRSAVAPRPATPHFAYVDAVAPFLAWASAAHPSDDYAVRAFREGVVAPHPELYERSVIGGREGETLDQRILRLLPRLRANAGAIANIHRRFASDSDAAVGRFRAALPDFSWRGPTYLFVSLGAMNGGTRQVAGKQALLFGVDVIADTEAIGVHPIEVLFAHELFHAHQLGVLGPDDAETRVYEALWLEGLATYASMKLVPGTAETAALPSTHAFGEKKERAFLPDEMRSHARALGELLRDRVDSTSQADYAAFFLGTGDPLIEGHVVRSGYWFGLQVARRLAESRSLADLARIHPRTIRKDIVTALDAVIASS